jgi:hypothetical protein
MEVAAVFDRAISVSFGAEAWFFRTFDTAGEFGAVR